METTTATTTRTARSVDLARLLKFAVVGASGYVVNLALFALLVRLGLHYAAAAVASFAVAVVNNYVWNRLWTFGDRRGHVLGQGMRFVVVAVAALGVNLLVLHVLVSAGLRALPAQAVAIVVVTPLNYVGNRLWSFGEASPLAALRERVGAERLAAYGRILGWGAASRAVVLGTALVVQALRWPYASWYPSVSARPFALLEAWDGRWYRLVAERGYLPIPRQQSDTAFFPLYPALMRLLHGLGLGWDAAGLLLANVGFALGLLALYELFLAWRLPSRTAERAAVYAALFPIGYVFSMAYPEGLVIAAMAGAGACALRGRWTCAAVLAAAGALARPEAVFVAIPLGVLALRRLRSRDAAGAVAAAAAGPAAFLAVTVYAKLVVGDPLAFSRAQQAWGRRLSLDGVHRAIVEVAHATGQNQWLLRDAAFCGLYLLLLVAARAAGVPWSWTLSGALIVLLPLESGSFTSDARFGLLALPVYAGLAALARPRVVDWLLRPLLLAGLGGATATILLRWP